GTRQLYQELLRRPEERAQPVATGIGRRQDPSPSYSPPSPDLPAAETPLFGRVQELGQLKQMLDTAMRGSGQIATVAGEAGIGNTRLVSAVVADALALGCRVLIGRCHESDSILSFGPWVDACRTGRIVDDEAALGALHPTRRAELVRLLPEV